jgi:hypothetical protein
MGCVYSLVNTRVTVTTDTLQQIIGILKITAATDRNRILRDGILIVKLPSPPGGGGPQPARARSSRSSTESSASSTRTRTSRRQT